MQVKIASTGKGDYTFVLLAKYRSSLNLGFTESAFYCDLCWVTMAYSLCLSCPGKLKRAPFLQKSSYCWSSSWSCGIKEGPRVKEMGRWKKTAERWEMALQQTPATHLPFPYFCITFTCQAAQWGYNCWCILSLVLMLHLLFHRDILVLSSPKKDFQSFH